MPSFVSVLDFGAKADGVILFDGAINATSTTFTSVTANFTEADIGKSIWVEGAGVIERDLLTTIASINSQTSVELTDAASATVSNVEARYGTDSTVFIQAAFDAASDSGLCVHFPRGK